MYAMMYTYIKLSTFNYDEDDEKKVTLNENKVTSDKQYHEQLIKESKNKNTNQIRNDEQYAKEIQQNEYRRNISPFSDPRHKNQNRENNEINENKNNLNELKNNNNQYQINPPKNPLIPNNPLFPNNKPQLENTYESLRGSIDGLAQVTTLLANHLMNNNQNNQQIYNQNKNNQ